MQDRNRQEPGAPHDADEDGIDVRLGPLLRSRYGFEGVRLSREQREAATDRLRVAVRERGSTPVRRPGRLRPIWAGLAIAAVIAAASPVWLPRIAGGRTDAPVRLLRAPAGARVPEGVVDPRGVLHLTFGRDHNGYYTRLTSGGGFEPARRLNHRLGTVMAGGERGPKLACGPGRVLHVVWLAQDPGGGGVYYTRSIDGGETFEPERNLLDVRAPCDSPAVAADAEGNVWVFWLDGRLPPDPASPVASPIFMARSADGGATFSRSEKVRHDHPGLACACCRLEARVGTDDSLYLSFRSGYQNVRDAYLLKGPKRENRFRAVRISEDDWLFAG